MGLVELSGLNRSWLSLIELGRDLSTNAMQFKDLIFSSQRLSELNDCMHTFPGKHFMQKHVYSISNRQNNSGEQICAWSQIFLWTPDIFWRSVTEQRNLGPKVSLYVRVSLNAPPKPCRDRAEQARLSKIEKHCRKLKNTISRPLNLASWKREND